ncbi:MAG: response regulator [Nitrosopumilus sp.]|uniref:response regulator n=1 Tax=Nitrosopumilus sp. TaxID=2024843 RepID=UPI00247E033A|nr:response regulator [Nitrosopumilus sp.]MCV0393059.1 response regulator [Nitrosopumilus sp.]
MIEKTAIIIDDDEAINSLLGELLTLYGYDVVGSGFDGNDAISLYTKHNPSIVLLDVRMPKKNGFEALGEIKKIDPSSTVIMITGEVESQTNDRLQSLGASAIVYKPFEVEKLIKVINKAIKSNKMIVQ